MRTTNNDIRGYTLGQFTTTVTGAVDPSSVVLFRAAETRGVGVFISTGGIDDTLITAFTPC